MTSAGLASHSNVGSSPSAGAVLEQQAALLGLRVAQRKGARSVLTGPDGHRVQAWREDHPYDRLLGRRAYKSSKHALQIELMKLQRWVKASGMRLLIVCEGRDAAGKGGVIRRMTENLNSRGLRIVALDKPAAHEHGENYLHRFFPHLPAPGEVVFMDRSWYNRAGVEYVLGFCQPQEYSRFLRDVPTFEEGLINNGVHLVKIWFSITRAEQIKRLLDRHADPVKCWKLSPADLASAARWDAYTSAEDVMFNRTHLPHAPWTVVKANDKRRARLEAMRYVLSLFDYDDKEPLAAGPPDRLIVSGPRLPRSIQQVLRDDPGRFSTADHAAF